MLECLSLSSFPACSNILWARLQPYLQTLDQAGKACQGKTLAYHEILSITAVNCFIVQAPRAFTIKLFTTVTVAISLKAKVFATAIHYHPSLIYAGKAGA